MNIVYLEQTGTTVFMDVLLIEDDKRIAALVERGLHEDGHTVSVAYSGNDGVAKLLGQRFDAALLDVLLPGMTGMAVLEQVRRRRCTTPILMLTAVDAVPKVLEAFDLGADDYLVKPFLLEILLARVRAIARRSQTALPDILQAGGLRLDRTRRTVQRDGQTIALTRKQAALLELLLCRNGLVTSREDLIEAGWGAIDKVKSNTLDVYIHSLRVKLHDEAASQPLIRTVHGSGYLFAHD